MDDLGLLGALSKKEDSSRQYGFFVHVSEVGEGDNIHYIERYMRTDSLQEEVSEELLLDGLFYLIQLFQTKGSFPDNKSAESREDRSPCLPLVRTQRALLRH
jgi:hypothetical protein